jgi:hypothetical protein
MFRHKHFDVDIERIVNGACLWWPTGHDAAHDSGLGGNRQYGDLRGLYWSDACEAFALEGELMRRIETAADPEEECLLIEDEQYEDPDDGLFGLDIGVASSVAALSAARCVPSSSCNGGAFGEGHHEAHPLVAFYAREPIVPLLLECAEQADAGVVQDGGQLVVYASDIRNMRRFAASLIDRRTEAASIRYRGGGRQVGENQPELF